MWASLGSCYEAAAGRCRKLVRFFLWNGLSAPDSQVPLPSQGAKILFLAWSVSVRRLERAEVAAAPFSLPGAPRRTVLLAQAALEDTPCLMGLEGMLWGGTKGGSFICRAAMPSADFADGEPGV